MKLHDITEGLDSFFKVHQFAPDSLFSSLLPELYDTAGINLEKYLARSFLEKYHGLMINNGKTVNKIYTTVFLSEEVLDKVFDRNERHILLISHHPLDMETSDRGFLPLSERYLKEMQERAVSVYILHTPLDVHDEVATSRALAVELELEGLKRYHRIQAGYTRLYGYFSTPVKFEYLLTQISKVTNVNDLHFIKKSEEVEILGIVTGGTDADGILETARLGCDTMLTGTYYNLVQNEIGKEYREAFNQIKDSLEINLIECSHYASEAIVMRIDMINLCTQLFDISVEFIPQENAWY